MIDNKKLLGNDNDIFQIKEVLEKSLDNKWTQEFVYLLRKFFYIEYWSNVEKNERYTIQMIQEVLKKHLDFLDEDRGTEEVMRKFRAMLPYLQQLVISDMKAALTDRDHINTLDGADTLRSFLIENSFRYEVCSSNEVNDSWKNIDVESSTYVIYTSGSTGKPKGVEIAYKSMVNTVLDINDRIGLNSSDTILGLSSLCFDLSVYDLFATFFTGAQLKLVKELRDTEDIKKLVDSSSDIVWNSVPAAMELFIDSLDEDYKNDEMKAVLLSGDWINVNLPDKIKKHFPKAAIFSLGGATEASIWSIYYPIKKVDASWTSIPYGYPLTNQSIYILDSEQRICPPEVIGEIYIGGIGVAKGYINDEEKTSNSFVKSKYGRLYRTGDFGNANATILEIGAGTGATSNKVLSDIRENKFEEHIVYFYTDISRFFLQRAKERYKECDGKIEMHHQTLDIDEAFSSQLPSNFQADIVIAVGVLNNSVNTDKCIYEINSVMKPGGILLVIETVEDVPDILITQSFMMTAPKDRRKATNTMFLNRKQWLEILEENGFCNSEEFPGYGEYLEVLGQKLFYCTKE